MAQKPLVEMADNGYESMSEESGFVLHTMKTTIIPLAEKLDKKVDHSEFTQAMNIFSAHKDNCTTSEIMNSITILAGKVDRLYESIRALSDKLDGEDVTNLDTDYRTAIDALL